MKKERFSVTGMTCAACVSHVERAVQGVEGVSAVQVNLLTNSMEVCFAPPATHAGIVKAVTAAGYGTKETGESKEPTPLPRLIASLCLLLPLLYLSMGHLMWGWPFFDLSPASFGLAELVLSGMILIINQKFFTGGWCSLRHGAPNMDVLVSMGAGTAFLYSTVQLFRLLETGDIQLLHGLYFESAGMILTLITLGKLLEAKSKGKTTSALQSLMALEPAAARILRDGQECAVPAEQVQVGDLFVLRPGDRVPVDGVVLEGESSVEEAALTGESLPVEKAPGSPVSAATVNGQGRLVCRATRVGQDTTLQRIIKMVEDATASKAPIARLADRVAGVFVPAVMGIALAVFLLWLLFGQSFAYALGRGISVLVISCPCALGLATPVAIMAGTGTGARHGILFKTAAALEQAGRIRYCVIDKTGTLTKGQPTVTEILPCTSREQLLSCACALEAGSEHPIGRAVACLQDKTCPVTEFRALPGFGVQGKINGKPAIGGSMALCKSLMTPELEAKGKALAQEGKTPLYFALDGKLLGIIAVADAPREDSAQAVAALKALGVLPIMLTGDNRPTAMAVAKQVGIDHVISDVLPGDKAQAVRSLQGYGAVAMVGDGINDAPALTGADLGIAMGAGTDIAMESAAVVLMRPTLLDVAAAIRLSRATLRNIKENLFWAFFYNCIGIPLAAGFFGLALDPMFGAAAMSLSSFFVVTNALRLNFFNPHKPGKQKKPPELPLRLWKQEEIKMEKTVYVNGMMCVRCAAHVEKALSGIPGVAGVQVLLEDKCAKVTLNAPVGEAAFAAAIQEAGYDFVKVED